MELRETKLYTDFDGTAVTGMDPRDLPKKPCQEMPQFVDFLGVFKSAGSIEIAKILTRRPGLLRAITAYEIRKFGLDEFFPDKSQVIHVRNDTLKSEYVVDESEKSNVALLDDSIHLVAPKILEQFTDREDLERLVTLAVPKKLKTQGRVFEFAKKAINLYGKESLKEFDYDASSSLINVGHRIEIGNSALNLVMLDAYSADSGEHLRDFLNQESVRAANLSYSPPRG